MAATEQTPLVNRSQSSSASTCKALIAKIALAWFALSESLSPPPVAPSPSAVAPLRQPIEDTSYICEDTNQDAGYIKLPDKEDDHYFYWYFESRSNPSKDPLDYL